MIDPTSLADELEALEKAAHDLAVAPFPEYDRKGFVCAKDALYEALRNNAPAIVRFLRAGAQQHEALVKLHRLLDFGEKLDPGTFGIQNTDFADNVFAEAHVALAAWREAGA